MTSRRRDLGAIGLVLAVALAVTTTAHAATFKSGFVTYERNATATASGNSTLIGAQCPGNRRVVGAGGQIKGPAWTPPYSHLASVHFGDHPFGGGTISERTQTESYNAHPQTQKTQAWALCLAPNAGAGDLQHWTVGHSAINGSDTSGSFWQCPSGKIVGGGQAIQGLASEEYLGSSGLATGLGEADDERWRSDFRIDPGVGGNHHPVLSAACLDSDELRLRHRYKGTVITTAEHKAVRVSCPRGGGRGWRVLSGGFEGGPFANVLASTPYDNGDSGKVPDDGWKVRSYLAFPDAERLMAFVVCGKRA